MENLKGKKVAILVADGFEQVELTEPRKALDEAGAKTSIVSPGKGRGEGLEAHDKADSSTVDSPLAEARAERLRRPAAARRRVNPDQLRMNPRPCVRARVLRRRQAGRRDLPRALDADRRRRGARPHVTRGRRSRPTSECGRATGSIRRS